MAQNIRVRYTLRTDVLRAGPPTEMTRGRAGRIERGENDFMILFFELIVLLQGCFRVANRCIVVKILCIQLVVPTLIQSLCQLVPQNFISENQLINFLPP